MPAQCWQSRTSRSLSYRAELWFSQKAPRYGLDALGVPPGLMTMSQWILRVCLASCTRKPRKPRGIDISPKRIKQASCQTHGLFRADFLKMLLRTFRTGLNTSRRLPRPGRIRPQRQTTEGRNEGSKDRPGVGCVVRGPCRGWGGRGKPGNLCPSCGHATVQDPTVRMCLGAKSNHPTRNASRSYCQNYGLR